MNIDPRTVVEGAVGFAAALRVPEVEVRARVLSAELVGEYRALFAQHHGARAERSAAALAELIHLLVAIEHVNRMARSDFADLFRAVQSDVGSLPTRAERQRARAFRRRLEGLCATVYQPDKGAGPHG